jgi:hypothetical protein
MSVNSEWPGVTPPHNHSSSPAKAGDPVRRGFPVQSSASLGYWVAQHPKPSLRATGSRECAPDNRLSEAIHRAAKKVRMDCFASLAMTADTVSHSRGAMRPRFAGNFRDLFKKEGAGNAGCALHPRSHAQRAQKVRA